MSTIALLSPVDSVGHAVGVDGLVAHTYVNAEIERAEPKLRELLRSLDRPTHVQHDPAWLRAEAFEHDCESMVVTLERGDRVVAAAPFLVRPWRWRARLGYTTVASFEMTLADLAGDSFIAPDDFALQERLVLAIAKAPVRYDLIYFEGLPTESLLHRVLKQSPHVRRAFWLDEVARPATHWRIAMPRSFDEYQKEIGGDRRRDLARRTRNLEKACTHGMAFHRITRRDQVAPFLAQVQRVSERSWQGTRLGTVVPATSRVVQAYEQRADRGWLRSYLLTDGDEPVAFQIGIQDDSAYHLDQNAYDPAWRAHSPGKVLLYKSLADLYEERTPKWFDFGTGDNDYKQDMSNDKFCEATLHVVRKSLRTAAAHATCTTIAALNDAVRDTLDRFELRSRIRRLLRGHPADASPR